MDGGRCEVREAHWREEERGRREEGMRGNSRGKREERDDRLRDEEVKSPRFYQ